MSGSNRTAIDEVIAALTHLGRIERVDAAKVATARSLADAVDAEPGNASLWREYRAAEADLRGTSVEVDDEFTRALAALRAPVGNPEEQAPAKSGRKRGGGGGNARPAADAVATSRRRRGDGAAG